jgi:two-component system nitrogen regulation response regulator GlnG
MMEDPPAPRRRPSDIGEEELIAALRTCRWNLDSTAKLLRIPRSSLYGLVDASPRVRRASDLDPEDIATCYRECRGDIAHMASRLEVSERALQRRIHELRLAP